MRARLIRSVLVLLGALASTGFMKSEERPWYLWTDSAGVLSISRDRPLHLHDLVVVPPAISPALARRPGYHQTVVPRKTASVMSVQARRIDCEIGRVDREELTHFKFAYSHDRAGRWHKLSGTQRHQRLLEADKMISNDCRSL